VTGDQQGAVQVEAGAPALHLDEIWVLGSGASATPNEGYDDYAIAAFRRYLRDRFPGLSAAQWKSRFGIEDLDTFDYREYLQNHSSGGRPWADDPDASLFDNPLAPLWKTPLLRDEHVHHDWFVPTPERSFHEWLMLDFARRLTSRIREGAKARGREVALAHNGPFPDMDFQNWNAAVMPEGSSEAALRPLHERWQCYRGYADRWSGRHTPAVTFIDWPGELPAWLKWPRSRQEAFLRTLPFEARCFDVHYAYHMRNFWPGSDAYENGTSGVILEQCRWLTGNRALFPETGCEPVPVSTSQPEITALARANADGETFIYLINFMLEDDAVKNRTQLRVHLPTATGIERADSFAPAMEGGNRTGLRTAPLTIELPELRAFAVIKARVNYAARA